MLHPIYMVTHIYITFMLLFISFFILLPHLWAGRLAPPSSLSGTRGINELIIYFFLRIYFKSETNSTFLFALNIDGAVFLKNEIVDAIVCAMSNI
jgi:hypothetical protein